MSRYSNFREKMNMGTQTQIERSKDNLTDAFLAIACVMLVISLGKFWYTRQRSNELVAQLSSIPQTANQNLGIVRVTKSFQDSDNSATTKNESRNTNALVEEPEQRLPRVAINITELDRKDLKVVHKWQREIHNSGSERVQEALDIILRDTQENPMDTVEEFSQLSATEKFETLQRAKMMIEKFNKSATDEEKINLLQVYSSDLAKLPPPPNRNS